MFIALIFFFFFALIFKSYLCLADYILNLFGSFFFFLFLVRLASELSLEEGKTPCPL